MKKLNNLYEEVLNEMPYIFDLDKYNIPNEGNNIDLELELDKSEKDLIKRFKKILYSSKGYRDKYGNIISIGTIEERERFIQVLLHDKLVLFSIKHILNLSTEEEALKKLRSILIRLNRYHK